MSASGETAIGDLIEQIASGVTGPVVKGCCSARRRLPLPFLVIQLGLARVCAKG